MVSEQAKVSSIVTSRLEESREKVEAKVKTIVAEALQKGSEGVFVLFT